MTIVAPLSAVLSADDISSPDDDDDDSRIEAASQSSLQDYLSDMNFLIDIITSIESSASALRVDYRDTK